MGMVITPQGGTMTRDWQSIAPPDEELIAEYKRIEPELRYLTWWYGDDCEDLIPPHSIDPWFIDTLLAHWEASDPEHFLRQLYTDRLPHDIIYRFSHGRLNSIMFQGEDDSDFHLLPAIETDDGHMEYYSFGILHREDGPAVIAAFGEIEQYWRYGTFIREVFNRVAE